MFGPESNRLIVNRYVEMKILLTHNFYQISGGEDAVVKNESDLLIKNGNEVLLHTVDNANINSLLSKALAMVNVPFSFSQYKKMLKVLKAEKPDVVHVHNYFPILSPSVFYACKKAKVPVVHTLHNYRAVCPTALLMHEGRINESSLTGSAWWTVTKRVYRDSFIGSFTLASMVELHKKIATWYSKVDLFIALTEFARKKYSFAGWPEEKIVVKPNFISDPILTGAPILRKRNYGLYVGRLSEEKGIDVLLSAWKNIKYPIKIIGEGEVESVVSPSVDLLGRQPKEKVIQYIKSSQFIVVPSICYEGFPMAIVEAFACGTPVLCSRLGSMEEIVCNGITGLHFEAGNVDDLAEKVQWMIDYPEEVKKMGRNARAEYLAKYTPEKNYEMLMDIYQQAMEESRKH